jgi:hypothetical protein
MEESAPKEGNIRASPGQVITTSQGTLHKTRTKIMVNRPQLPITGPVKLCIPFTHFPNSLLFKSIVHVCTPKMAELKCCLSMACLCHIINLLFLLFTMPFYLVYREAWLDLLGGIQGILVLGFKTLVSGPEGIRQSGYQCQGNCTMVTAWSRFINLKYFTSNLR